MKIVTICGAGVGTSAILKINAERVLEKMGLEAQVIAAHLDDIGEHLDDAQIILTSPEFADRIGHTWAEVIEIDNFFDTDELRRKISASLD